jgi:hypothetical protein
MENLVVDGAYRIMDYPMNIVVKIEDEYYLLPALNRHSNDLTKFKKLSKLVINNKELRELLDYEYVTKELEKKSGYEIKVGRAITDEEFDELKQKFNLTEDDISEPFEFKKGAIFGEKYEIKYTCLQIQLDNKDAMEMEQKLKEKGIEAANIAADRLNIRINK